MVHLYVVTFGAVAAANIIAVVAIAAAIKRDRSRFMAALAMAKRAEVVKSHLSRWL